MSKSFQSQSPARLWVVLAIGYLVGRIDHVHTALQKLYAFVDKGLIPLYLFLVLVYIFNLIFQSYTQNKSRVPKREVPALKPAPESALADEGAAEDQPCDLTGVYKLVSLENFEPFLEVQGKNNGILQLCLSMWSLDKVN